MHATMLALTAVALSVGLLAGPDGPAAGQLPQFAPINPCWPLTMDQARPDLAFGQVSPGPQTSPDGRVRVMMRYSPPRARMLNVEVAVTNLGARAYRATDSCTTTVAISMNEGPNNNPITPTHSESEPLGLVGPGSTRGVTFEVVLRGTGLDGSGSNWNEAYQYVLLSFNIDPPNMIIEGSETNNSTGPYCYDAPGNRFVAMSFCPGG